ncbi:MAG: hypothetical protein Q7T78_17685 [Rhodoferax sp.]|nr:hypothetical protein [Rhodoferax sp.]
MFLSTQINIATLAQNEKGQARKNGESHCNFPHINLPETGPYKCGAKNGPHLEGHFDSNRAESARSNPKSKP